MAAEAVQETVEGGLGVAEGVAVVFEAADHEGAFEGGDEGVGDAAGVRGASDFAGPDAGFEDVDEAGAPVLDAFAGEVAEGGIAVVGVDGGVHEGAAAGDGGGQFDEEVDDAFELVEGVGDFVEVLGADFDVLGEGVAEGLGGQVFLISEVPVEPAFFKACGGHEVLHGAAVEAALIEDGGGFGDDALSGGFAFSHFICLANSAYRKKDASVAFLMNLMMKETEWSLLSCCSRKDDDGDCDSSTDFANSDSYAGD